jgi:hypothetical protein
MSHLRYLCLFAYSSVFFCFVCLRLVYLMLPVSLDCPSVFSNVFLFVI